MTRRTDGGPVDHAEDQRVFSIFEFDVFGGLHFATWKANVEWDIVGPLVQLVASRCYVLVERSARLELDGYDSVVWHVALEACASSTL